MSLNRAKKEARDRLHKLEIDRRSQIVAAVGGTVSMRVIICGDGSLSCMGMMRPEMQRSIMLTIERAGVNTGTQWTPLPKDANNNIATWQKAARRKEAL